MSRPAPSESIVLEARRLAAAGETDAVAAAWSAIARREGELAAWTWIGLTHRSGAGRHPGVLRGLPLGVKDVMHVAGMPTSFGLRASERTRPAQRSASVVARLVRGGAVPIGKTVTTPLTLDEPGPTRNPVDPRRSPGASSSGSAAAVAAGMAAIATGTQTIGSIVKPASYCGVWAWIPARATVPRRGCLVASPTLDRIGLFATDLPTLVAAARTVAGTASSDSAGGCDSCGSGGGSTRLLVPARAGWPRLRPQWEAALEAAVRVDGVDLVFADLDLVPEIERALDAARVIAQYEMHVHLPRARDPGELVSARTIAAMMPPRPPRARYRAAMAAMESMQAAYRIMLRGFDAMLLPAATASAPFGLADTGDAGPAAFGSLLGAPTIVAPVFRDTDRMPIGMQILGIPDGNARLLHVAGRLFASA